MVWTRSFIKITRKVANYLGDVLEDQRDKLGENLLAGGVDLATYVTHFRWDMAKYPIKQSLKNIAEIISKQALFLLILIMKTVITIRASTLVKL